MKTDGFRILDSDWHPWKLHKIRHYFKGDHFHKINDWRLLNKFEKKSCHQQWTHWSESNSIILQIYSKLSNWATMIYIRFSTVKFLYKKGVIKISGGLRFSKIKIGTCRIRCGILPRLVRFESHICCRIIEYIQQQKIELYRYFYLLPFLIVPPH